MSIFILIHGGAHGGWCWDRLVPELEARGHEAIAPDLPGMANDPSPLSAATSRMSLVRSGCSTATPIA